MTVTIVFCLRRRSDIARQEFLDHWSQRHAPLVRQCATALHIRRYDQSVPVESRAATVLAEVRGAPEPFDGVATLWFDSVADMQAAGATPEGRSAAKVLLEDERRFIDLVHSPIWLAEPHREI